MAISKDIAIHSSKHLSRCMDYQTGGDKAKLKEEKLTADDVDRVFSYAENLEKTVFRLDGDETILASGVGCAPETASIEFEAARERYMQKTGGSGRHGVYGTKTDKMTGERVSKESVEAYHIIQSFEADPDLDPRLVHKIGIEFCEKAFPGHKCLVATHMNTGHLHNHIVMCAYNNDGVSKFHGGKTARARYREINDEISLSYGLPILLDANIDHKNVARTRTETYLASTSSGSWKQEARNTIDEAISLASSWEEFVKLMQKAGYEVRERGKNYTVTHEYACIGGSSRTIRGATLGADYSRESVIQRISLSHGLATHQESEKTPKAVLGTEQTYQKQLHLSLYVSRYAENGRRRTELEILFIRALRLIRFFKDMFAPEYYSPAIPSRTYKSYPKRARELEHALYICRKYDIQSRKDLRDRLNETGAQLSHYRKVLRTLKDQGNQIRSDSPAIESADTLHVEALVSDYASKYRILKRLEKDIECAKDISFTHGPAFGEHIFGPDVDLIDLDISRS